ncbi:MULTISPECIES: YaiI/YqxD family protein [Halomonadaceae]|uniref:YaiI/YqxD family protein n=1 Tax=Halomonadaceae TaxID=28256 RepID=UPI001581DD1B|nr:MULTISPECIES: YaiI/YqxD family protein [Halomonas]MDI4637408.1 YaiI/YqxD family protein [Halomonas sp. BMC7]NUJ61243.1 YaiI/YqxD family protein [Halomonas taeanensis]
MPSLWVDADACPRVAREIIVRAAERTQTPTWFVANHQVPLPPSPWVKPLAVASGFDAADDEIVRRLVPGDLLVTADLPLAQEAIDKGAAVMTNRGETLDRGNIRARVQMRDFMETMRSSGEHTGGPKGYSDVDRREFANALDRWLAKNV